MALWSSPTLAIATGNFNTFTLHVYFHSQFLWDLTNEIYCPPDDIVKVWIDRLSDMLGVTLYYSRVIDIFVARANKLRTESRKLKGGRQRKSYFERVWNFHVQLSDIKTIQDLSAENKTMKSKVEELQQQLASSSQCLQPAGLSISVKVMQYQCFWRSISGTVDQYNIIL